MSKNKIIPTVRIGNVNVNAVVRVAAVGAVVYVVTSVAVGLVFNWALPLAVGGGLVYGAYRILKD